MRPAPFDPDQALAMLQRTVLDRLLGGFRAQRRSIATRLRS